MEFSADECQVRLNFGLRPNLGLSILLSEMLRPKLGLSISLRPKLRQEVKLGLSILLRPKFLLSDLLRLDLSQWLFLISLRL